MKIIFSTNGDTEYIHEFPIDKVNDYLRLINKLEIIDEEGDIYKANPPQYDINTNCINIGLEPIK